MAFTMEPGESSVQIFEVGDNLTLIQLLERVDPDAEEIDSLVEDERENLLARKRNAQITDWLDFRRNTLQESGDFLVDLVAIQSGR